MGYVAFGTATSPGSVPQVGSATYKGPVSGMTDITYADHLYGGYAFFPADGSVTVNVDFGTGKIGGFLALSIPDGMNPR